MSADTDTTSSPTETARERKARLTAEAAANSGQGNTETPAADGAETPTATRAKAPDTSGIELDAINAAALAPADLIEASAPTRERKPEQKAMDEVAAKAYAAWLKAQRPTVWGKMPVVTYFLTEEEVPGYRYLIRRACSIVEPAEGSPGVRVRFGNEFTLSEEMAAKIGRPDDAGKTVLAWAAVDKRTMEDKPSS
jgi:hypothetical protein